MNSMGGVSFRAELFPQPRVVVRGHCGQPLQKSNDIPESFVAVCRPERRHSRHLEPISQDPEKLSGVPVPRLLRKARRSRTHSRSPVGRLQTWRTMALHAHSIKVSESVLNLFVGVLFRRADRLCPTLDRVAHRRVERPACHREVRVARGNVVRAGKK